MNYLAHAFLSFGNKDYVAGNMIADHVKGKLVLQQYTAGVAKGIMLHRFIDTYTDTHFATLRGKLLFREHYGLYSGAIMDVVFDHFLANDPKYFKDITALKLFSEKTYSIIEQYTPIFPVAFAAYFPYMKERDWFTGYRSIKGLEQAFGGLARRAKHMPPPQQAYETFVSNYYLLNQCYYEIIDDIIRIVKTDWSN